MKFKEIIFIILVLVSINVVSAMNISQGTIFHPSDTNAYYNVSSSFDNVNNITINSTSLIFDTDKGIMIFNNNPDVETYYDFSFFNITAKGVLTNVSIDNFSLNITYENDSWNFSTFDSWISVPLIHNYTYNITIDAPGYALYNYTTLLNIADSVDYSFTLYTTNSINFSFRNELDNSLINSNVTAELISDAFRYNISTINGTYYLDLISPQEYNIRYEADGYDSRSYYFTLSNRTYNELDLYLSNQSFTNVTATCYDGSNQLLEGATIRYLKYDSDSNSYNLVGMVKTNFEGEAVMPLVLNSEFYKFQIYYDDVLEQTTTPSYIYSDTLTFRVTLTDLVATTYFESLGLSGDVSYNNETNNLRYDFSTDSGLNHNFCLYLYTVSNINGNTLINSSCSSTSSGTILLNVPIINGTTYFGKGVVSVDGETFMLDSEYVNFFSDLGNKDLWLFGFLIITVLFALSSIYSLRASFFLTPLPLFLGSLMKVIPISPGITGGFLIVGIILAVVVSK